MGICLLSRLDFAFARTGLRIRQQRHRQRHHRSANANHGPESARGSLRLKSSLEVTRVSTPSPRRARSALNPAAPPLRASRTSTTVVSQFSRGPFHHRHNFFGFGTGPGQIILKLTSARSSLISIRLTPPTGSSLRRITSTHTFAGDVFHADWLFHHPDRPHGVHNAGGVTGPIANGGLMTSADGLGDLQRRPRGH